MGSASEPIGKLGTEVARLRPLDSVSQNGQLGSESPRPAFQIHAPQGLSVEAKRKMIKSVSAAVAKAYNNLPGLLILFLECPQDRVQRMAVNARNRRVELVILIVLFWQCAVLCG